MGVVERTGGSNVFVVGLVAGDNQIELAIDRIDGQHYSGLYYVDGKPVETVHVDPLLPAGSSQTIRCRVWPGHIEAVVGEQKIVDWRGKPRR